MGMRMGWESMAGNIPGFGADFKHALRQPGPWGMAMFGFGECLPYKSNRVYLSESKTDRFGIPQVAMDFNFRENENAMREDIVQEAIAMLTAAGCQNVFPIRNNAVGGNAVHEMGGARMGIDPSQSVLNEWNQAHDVPNLFVTDGASMTSSSCVNPSLTFMALTARAADFAVKQLESGIL